MAENTPLMSETLTNDFERNSRWPSNNPSRRSYSTPPTRGFKEPDDSDDDLFLTNRYKRPQTSLAYGTEDWRGSSLNNYNRNSSEEDVGNDDGSQKEEKTKWLNIALLNIVMLIWSIAAKVHGPVTQQYLYRRVLEEVFGNSTLPGSGNSSDGNSTFCYKPSLNDTGEHNDSYTLQELAQQMTTEINMKFAMVSYALCLVSVVMVGSYSDYIGRKVLFLVPMFGQLVNYTIVTIIIYWNLDIHFLYITSVIAGICTGELYAIACDVYVTENTPPKASRTLGLTLIEVVDALTTAALSTGVGYFIQLEGFFLPSATAIGIIVLNIIAVIFILPSKKKRPEDLAKRKKDKPSLNPLKALKNVFGFYFFEGTRKARAMFLVYFVGYFIHIISQKMGNINLLWEMNYPLCWTPEMIGYYGTGSTVVGMVIKLPLLKLLQCCMVDEIIAIYSNVVYIGALVLKSFALNDMLMYGVSLVSAFSVTVHSIIKSELSEMAGENRLGSLYAGFAIVNIICDMLGTPSFSEIYKYTLNLFRGTSYLVSAGGQVVCTVFLIAYVVLSRKGYRSSRETIEVVTTEPPKTSRDTAKEEDTEI